MSSTRQGRRDENEREVQSQGSPVREAPTRGTKETRKTDASALLNDGMFAHSYSVVWN